MDDGRAIQACLRLVYFAATIVSLLTCLFLVMQWTSVSGDEHVDSQFIQLQSEVDRAAFSRVDSLSDPSKDFFKA